MLATEGNLNNHIGVALTLTRLDPAGHRLAVVEAGVSAPGEMQALAGMIEPDLAIITLVAPAHLLELGDARGGGAREGRAARRRAAGRHRDLSAAVRCNSSAFRDLVGAHDDRRAGRGGAPGRAAEGQGLLSPSPSADDTTALAIAYGPPPPLVFTMQRVSAGMAQNAVLAICAALWLGVAPEVIQQRLTAWQPAQWRGELRREGGRLLYLDCYNANPASMADALDNFLRRWRPPAEPRAYVLGCMEELGPRAAEYHRRLGRTLHLRPGDRLFIIGDQAAALRAGPARKRQRRRSRSRWSPDLAPVAAFLAGFRGAVFLKGSRRLSTGKGAGRGRAAGARRMLSYLSQFESSFGPLRLLRFITLRTLMAAGTAALIGFLIGPWLIAQLRALKFGQHYDDDRTGDLAQRFDKKNTPTMGGLLIFFAVFGSTFLWAAAQHLGGGEHVRLCRAHGGGLSRRLSEGRAQEPRRHLVRGEDPLADADHRRRAGRSSCGTR